MRRTQDRDGARVAVIIAGVVVSGGVANQSYREFRRSLLAQCGSAAVRLRVLGLCYELAGAYFLVRENEIMLKGCGAGLLVIGLLLLLSYEYRIVRSWYRYSDRAPRSSSVLPSLGLRGQ